jgi:putative nucleotidyltransferase with HDIG domain
MLPIILKSMGSKYGIFGYLNSDGSLVARSMTRDVFDSCDSPEKDIVFPQSTWGNSSWPRAIREKKTNYSNEPSVLTPKGHVPMLRYISLPIINQGDVIGLFVVANKETDYDEQDVQSLQRIADYVAPLLRSRLQRVREQEARIHSEELLRLSLHGTITVVSKAVEARDPYTAGHQLRVADLAVAIATELGLDTKQVEGIRLGASIHDIGKIQVPSEILSKPSKLSNAEFSLIQVHPEVGYEILKDIDFPWPIADVAYQHHERIDGSGYPQGLKGDEICIEARIVAVADVVEAICSHRPYRAGLGIDAALKEIKIHKGTHYDVKAVDACLKIFREKRFSF